MNVSPAQAIIMCVCVCKCVCVCVCVCVCGCVKSISEGISDVHGETLISTWTERPILDQMITFFFINI